MSRVYGKGLTLTELLLAAAILALVLCGLVALFINCSILNESNRNLTSATTHAQFVMEEIRDSVFPGLETAINNGNWDWDAATIAARGLNVLPNESIDSSVFQSGNPLGVSVSVSWNDRGTRSRNTAIQTLITDY